MSIETNDILVEIPDNELPKLALLYEENAHWAPYMISFVHMGIHWKKSEKYRKCITFTSPKNSWEKDGTIVAILTCSCYDIFVFTLDDNQIQNLHQGLVETDFIDYTKKPQFFSFHAKYHSTIKKVLEEKNLKFSYKIPLCHFMGLPPEECKKLTIECPSDVYVKKLEPSAAKHIVSVYPHKRPGLEGYVSSFIEINGGYGVFSKSTDDLVAWVVNHCFWNVGILQVDERYKNKGLGSLLVKVLSKELGNAGFWACATVVTNNVGAFNMFEKLGFKKINTAVFIAVE